MEYFVVQKIMAALKREASERRKMYSILKWDNHLRKIMEVNTYMYLPQFDNFKNHLIKVTRFLSTND